MAKRLDKPNGRPSCKCAPEFVMSFLCENFTFVVWPLLFVYISAYKQGALLIACCTLRAVGSKLCDITGSHARDHVLKVL